MEQTLHYNEIIMNSALFDISFASFNLLSLVLGMFFGATMWRVKAMYFVAFYFIGVSLFYGMMYYLKANPHLIQ